MKFDINISRIPGDGRCLFRAVTHGACLRAGKPTPSENLQKELADELRNKPLHNALPSTYLQGEFRLLLQEVLRISFSDLQLLLQSREHTKRKPYRAELLYRTLIQ
ncbi:hypothetical protein IEQ34_001507 [Dendrobium chrysotoxum]|uniref:OTU domain-containing protein n=1 Tax=Dendrobium chrysotoxum TaxID=161865 RepID=A0AAV7H836_DENCH|nr:hypothetical protein IEQ34_001507 [Dendrobium chrysotoxum]